MSLGDSGRGKRRTRVTTKSLSYNLGRESRTQQGCTYFLCGELALRVTWPVSGMKHKSDIKVSKPEGNSVRLRQYSCALDIIQHRRQNAGLRSMTSDICTSADYTPLHTTPRESCHPHPKRMSRPLSPGRATWMCPRAPLPTSMWCCKGDRACVC